MNTKWLVAIAVIFSVGLIGLAYYFTVRDSGVGPRTVPLSDTYKLRQEKGAWTKGSETPIVTVEEFSDFQCPGCRGAYLTLQDAIAETSDIVQLKFHSYVIPSHDKAGIAALAAESAGRQGKFWEMYDLIFARQLDWVQKSPLSFRKDVENYAQNDLQLNIEQFKNDMKDTSTQTEIDKDMQLADAIPLDATPTILINGKKLENIPQTKEEMVKLIQEAALEVK